MVRCDSFAALPFLPKPKKQNSGRTAASAKAITPAKEVASVEPSLPDERFEKLVTRLKHSTAPRPKKRDRLLAYINTVFGGKLSATDQTHKLNELIARGIVTIEAKDKLAYG